MLWLAGCTSGGGAIVDTLKYAAHLSAAPPEPRANRILLRTQLGSSVSYMALGYTEPHPHNTSTPVEVWFTAQGEVIKLHQGRVVQTLGLSLNWHAVQTPALPAWPAVGDSGFEYVRARDEMPGYRLGLQDRVEVQKMPPPPEWAGALKRHNPMRLQWFIERAWPVGSSAPAASVVARPAAQTPAVAGVQLPPAVFAVDMQQAGAPVVFSRQCLSAQACLVMELWPPQAAGATP